MKRQRCKMKRKDLRENSGNIETKQRSFEYSLSASCDITLRVTVF